MPDNKNDSLASLTERLREARKIADEYPWGQPGSGTVKAVVGDVLEAADEIERLQAENAALKARLVVDDAMVERATSVHNRYIVGAESRPDIAIHPPLDNELLFMHAALEAALGAKEVQE